MRSVSGRSPAADIGEQSHITVNLSEESPFFAPKGRGCTYLGFCRPWHGRTKPLENQVPEERKVAPDRQSGSRVLGLNA